MNHQRQFDFWQRGLVIANIIFAIFGLLVAFAGDSFIFSMHNAKNLELFFGGQALSPEMAHYKKWIFGVAGGTIAGFHVLAYFVAKYPFKQKEKWAYNALLYALLSWFIVDSGLSIYHGVYHNVYLVNIVTLFGIGLPLLMTKRYFIAS